MLKDDEIRKYRCGCHNSWVSDDGDNDNDSGDRYNMTEIRRRTGYVSDLGAVLGQELSNGFWINSVDVRIKSCYGDVG